MKLFLTILSLCVLTECTASCEKKSTRVPIKTVTVTKFKTREKTITQIISLFLTTTTTTAFPTTIITPSATTFSTSTTAFPTTIITPSTTTFSTTSTTTFSTTSPTASPKTIPITSGKTATLTYFTDTTTQCYGENIPPGNGLAVNPLLLGFTLNDWNTKYANANPNVIPWCGKKMNVTVNGKSFIGTIIDTCNPGDDGAFADPNTGLIIGGKCDYTNVIDLYSTNGLQFLQSTVGDDFYQGNVDWVIM